MAYVDQNMQGNRKAGIIGVVAIHAVLGTVVVTGLSTVIPLVTEEPPLVGENFKVPLDPPEPTEIPKVETPYKPQRQDIFVPDNPFKFETETDVTTSDQQPVDDTFVYENEASGSLVESGPKPTPTPEPTFDPILAKPSNAPGRWVTNADYKPAWVRREMQGVVSFALQVDASGRVSDCRVTRSSGFGELDDATCRLVRQRAKFTAARDGKGLKVPGTYANSVRWELPK
jgi:protein TonB